MEGTKNIHVPPHFQAVSLAALIGWGKMEYGLDLEVLAGEMMRMTEKEQEG